MRESLTTKRSKNGNHHQAHELAFTITNTNTMLEQLTAHELTLSIKQHFADSDNVSIEDVWLGQSTAKQSASMGLQLRYPGYAMAVVAEPDSGVTHSLLNEMRSLVEKLPTPQAMLYLNNFTHPERPLLFRVSPLMAKTIRDSLEQFVRELCKTIASACHENASQEASNSHKPESLSLEISALLVDCQEKLKQYLMHEPAQQETVNAFLRCFHEDVMANVPLIQAHIIGDNESGVDAIVHRYKANVLVDYDAPCRPAVILDEDPSLQSLFGGIESSSEHGGDLPDYLRIRAGNLLKANGGFLMVHLRDLLADSQQGPQLLEKVYRFLRNGKLYIEDASSHANQSVAVHTVIEPISVDVKVIVVATPQEFYTLQEDMPDLAKALRLKVEFEEPVLATEALYSSAAARWQSFAKRHQLPFLESSAIVQLLIYLHREAESQQRISSRWQLAEQLIVEAAYLARLCRPLCESLSGETILSALAFRQQRNCLTEQQWRNAIIDGEIVVNVHGRAIGQINGLTHVDMGDHSFGSPVRISARCYAGESGVVNIDREIQMTGASHDKGLLILKHWLSASFAHLTPLSLNASLVFEQEYQGVDGDSATCAELYALLSAIAGLSLPQGIAVTGAMNQHGEVMAVGGLNEKIEGYFSLCKTLGLNGSQGVLIPSRNLNHLMLNQEVIQAVESGQFQIMAIDHVLDGMEFLTGLPMGQPDDHGHYGSETLMGRVERSLEEMRRTMAENKPSKSQ